MLMFLACVLEQMDLALEHIEKGGGHDARFGLMMTDNAIELILHQTAKEQKLRIKAYPHIEQEFKHKKELEEAMGRTFEAKLRFVRLQGLVTEEQSRTITIMHAFRNDLYHVGLQYEAILPDLARFYFATACKVLAGFDIRGFSYSFNIVLPERALKYFSGNKFSPGKPQDFAKACQTLDDRCAHQKGKTIRSLADHMESTVTDCDTYLDIVAGGIYEDQRRTRDQAVVECQTWPLAFTTGGRDFARNKSWRGRTIFDLTDWLGQNYPLQEKKDPIPGWRRQVTRLRSQGNPHTALANYQSFMIKSQPIREALLESATQAEAEIDRLVHDRKGG